MKKSLRARIRNGLFPEPPEMFSAKLLNSIPIRVPKPELDPEFESERGQSAPQPVSRRTRVASVLLGFAAGLMTMAAIVFVVQGAFRHAAQMPEPVKADTVAQATIVGEWTLDRIDYNGIIVSSGAAGLFYPSSMTFDADGTATLDAGTYAYTIDGSRIVLAEATDPDGSEMRITYDEATDTLRRETSLNIKTTYIYTRVPKDAAIKNSVSGVWVFTKGTDYAMRITVRADGTATLKTAAGILGVAEMPLRYTAEDDTLQFSYIPLGAGRPFTARYDGERDVLTVTMDGETDEFTRGAFDVANSKWTLTKVTNMGVERDPSMFGMQFYLAFTGDTATVTMTYGNNTETEKYRYSVIGGSIALYSTRDDTEPARWLHPDAETDTLHMDLASVYLSSGMTGEMIFSRTPDAVIPRTEPDLVGKWTVTGTELNGNPDTSGSWMHEEYLEFSGKNSVTRTAYDAAWGNYQIEQYRYSVSGNTVELQKDGGSSHMTLNYDPATDTLRLDTDVVYSNPAAPDDVVTSIFSRTPDAVIPEPEKKSLEDMLEGLWCALSTEEGQDGLLEIRFYYNSDADERLVLYREGEFEYDGYSYTVEEGERNGSKTDNPWYRFTFVDGDEAFLIDLCMDTDGRNPLYMDWNVGKGKGGWKTYWKCPVIEADELPYQQTAYYGAGEGFVGYLDAVDLNGDGNPVRVKVASSDPNWYTNKGTEPTLTVQIGRGEWTANEALVRGSLIYTDLDPNDGHGNVLLSAERADGMDVTYELHLEGDTVVCGHAVEGYCFLADSPQEELTVGVPTDLFGAKYGYREIRGEALEPVDDRLYATGVIDTVMFGDRDKNIEDGTLLHLVRALPCEIDDVPGTLEPGVYLYLREWNEAMTEIVFLTEDGRRITVHPDAGLMLSGISLYDFFDNAKKE